jgi:hypothetical protein
LVERLQVIQLSVLGAIAALAGHTSWLPWLAVIAGLEPKTHLEAAATDPALIVLRP